MENFNWKSRKKYWRNKINKNMNKPKSHITTIMFVTLRFGFALKLVCFGWLGRLSHSLLWCWFLHRGVFLSLFPNLFRLIFLNLLFDQHSCDCMERILDMLWCFCTSFSVPDLRMLLNHFTDVLVENRSFLL